MTLKPGPVAPGDTDINQDFGIRTPEPSPASQPGCVLVTGASTGIGWETVKKLSQKGWQVIATARRADRLAALAKITGAKAFVADLTIAEHVEALHEYVTSFTTVNAVVNNAGGALGMDTVAEADPDKWRTMYENNVLSALRVTQAFLPQMQTNGGGDLVFVTSVAGHETYPGGSGYTAAKHAEAMLPATLRLELVGQPIRIIEIIPGLVQTPEFSLNRLGDKTQAEAVYSVLSCPLVGADIAQAIAWALSLPAHVNIDQMTVRPVEQANSMLKKRLGK